LDLASEAKQLEKDTKELAKIFEEENYTTVQRLNIAANRAMESNKREDWDEVYQLES